MPSTSSCGRGITWTEMTSPTLPAAAAPASVAALTAPTSPRTITVTKPPPICSRPINRTLAALTIASAASIAPTRPFVSISPSAPRGVPLEEELSGISVSFRGFPQLRSAMGCRIYQASSFGIESALTESDGVDHRDDGRVRRRGFGSVRNSRGAACRNKHDFALARAGEIDRDEGRLGVPGISAVVERGDQQQFERIEAGHLDRRDDVADHPP